MTDRSININVPVLARVEGEGALDVRIDNDRISELRLRIFEPPRYFEKLLEGRDYSELPDMVARICGICPVAYQMSAVQAVESIFNVQISPWVRAMRRLFYCGEWLQSHSLHIHLLAAPDFCGVSNVIELARKHPDQVRSGLRLQSAGNQIIELMGARSVHPVGACVGGFYKAPAMEVVATVYENLQQAADDADALLEWLSSLKIPDDQQSFNQVSLRHDHEYPMNEGRIVSSQGLDCAIEDFEQYFHEHQEPHSTALHCLLDDEPYLVGPLARLNNNIDRLPEPTAGKVKSLGLSFPLNNMFHSLIARAIEIHYAVHEALRILDSYAVPDESRVTVTPIAGTGYGCTEAPRGLLWHRYQVGDDGIVRSARIVPPTSQNQSRIEQDLAYSLQQFGFDKDESALRQHAETVIRNYDPCISCATHFLTVNVDRQRPALKQTEACSTDKHIVVIGIGSPQLYDQAGWQVVERLMKYNSDNTSANINYFVLDRPGLRLRDYLADVDVAIVVDAMCGNHTDSVICFDAGNLTAGAAQLSSHAVGLEATLALLFELDELPSVTWVYAVGSDQGEASVVEATRLIRSRLAAHRH